MQIEAGSIPAGAVAIIVIAAIAIGIGFMTLICSLVSVAKNHRRAARLQYDRAFIEASNIKGQRMVRVGDEQHMPETLRATHGQHSLSAERVISPGACPSLGRRLPSLAGTGGHLVLSFFPHPLSSQTPPSASERTRKPFATVAEAPPSYEEALRMAIEDSLRHTQQSSQTNIAIAASEVTENSSPPAIPPRRFLDMPLPNPQRIVTESNNIL
uniref:Nematode cuticle collagen N-terminal domain-containing protein n=1 Tax=Ascaris lumbricoides TaxID=6252 RepID=A0A0M3IE96_ASCLU